MAGFACRLIGFVSGFQKKYSQPRALKTRQVQALEEKEDKESFAHTVWIMSALANSFTFQSLKRMGTVFPQALTQTQGTCSPKARNHFRTPGLP